MCKEKWKKVLLNEKGTSFAQPISLIITCVLILIIFPFLPSEVVAWLKNSDSNVMMATLFALLINSVIELLLDINDEKKEK